MARSEIAGAVRRVSCDAERCRELRKKRGQLAGRFLFAYYWERRGLRLLIVCPECGQEHNLLLPNPRLSEEVE